MEEAGVPDVLGTVSAFRRGEKVKVPYALYDMGDDAVACLWVDQLRRPLPSAILSAC